MSISHPNTHRPSTPLSNWSARGTEPKVSTDNWVFFEDCTRKISKPSNAGPFLTEWSERFDVFAKPYKELLRRNVRLPPVPRSTAPPTSRLRKSSVYTRYTSAQHKRKEAAADIEKTIHKPVGLYNQFADQVSPHRLEKLKYTLNRLDAKEEKRGDHQKAQEDLTNILHSVPNRASMDKGRCSTRPTIEEKDEIYSVDSKTKRSNRGSFDSKEEPPAMNTDELEAMITETKNLYMYHAKPPKPTRDEILKAKTNATKKKKAEEEEYPWGSPEEIRLKEHVQEFCDWVTDLGGDEDNIDETTVNCLFSSGYDTTPAMSVPIVLVKPCDLPDGVRDHISGGTPPSSDTGGRKDAKKTKLTAKKSSGTVACRYGAFYLQPKTWKKMRKDEKLMDPKEVALDNSMAELVARKRILSEELVKEDIAKDFENFLKVRGARFPEFVTEVAQIRIEHEEVARQKAEAAERAKLEYQFNRYH